jgi:hypothetical protein
VTDALAGYNVLTSNMIIDYRIGVKTNDYQFYNYFLFAITHMVDSYLNGTYVVQQVADLSSFVRPNLDFSITADSLGKLYIST